MFFQKLKTKLKCLKKYYFCDVTLMNSIEYSVSYYSIAAIIALYNSTLCQYSTCRNIQYIIIYVMIFFIILSLKGLVFCRRNDKIIVFSDNVFALKHYAIKLNKYASFCYCHFVRMPFAINPVIAAFLLTFSPDMNGIPKLWT